MKRLMLIAALAFPMTVFLGCKGGNNYKVEFKMLRQNTDPATGFKVDVWVKGVSQPVTLVTDSAGMAVSSKFPKPDAQHPLEAAWHYYLGKKDQTREITYPYIESDAKRIKDTQYIPNTATPDPA